jgi:hypothetical protein
MDLGNDKLGIQYVLKHRLCNDPIEAPIRKRKSMCIADDLCSGSNIDIGLDQFEFGALDEIVHPLASLGSTDHEYACSLVSSGDQVSKAIESPTGPDGSGRRRHQAV